MPQLCIKLCLQALQKARHFGRGKGFQLLCGKNIVMQPLLQVLDKRAALIGPPLSAPFLAPFFAPLIPLFSQSRINVSLHFQT